MIYSIDDVIIVVVLEMNFFFIIILPSVRDSSFFIIEYEKCRSFPFFFLSRHPFTPYIIFILLKDQNSVLSQVHLLFNCFFGF